MENLTILALAIISPILLGLAIRFDNHVRENLKWMRHEWIPRKHLWLWAICLFVWPVGIIYAMVISIDAGFTWYYYRKTGYGS